MASKTTLNAKNLEALGAERMAQLLIEVSTGNAAAKRKLRLALAGAQSPREAAREITKRLTSIARARSFINWKNRKALVTDLETQRRAIVEQIAPADPDEALALMWRFMALATPVFERCGPLEAWWKHEGENRCAIPTDRAKRGLACGVGKCRKLRKNSRFRAIVHGSFGTAHNLKVRGSNPLPATKIYRVVKRLRAALRGGVCVSTTRGSTVEARGNEVLHVAS